MQILNLMAGGAVIGVITACWSYIKGAAWKLVSLLVQRVEIHRDEMANEVLSYLVANYQRSRVYDRTYSAAYERYRKRGLNGWVPFETIVGHAVVFWNGWFPIIAAHVSNKRTADPNSDEESGPLVLTFIRHTFNVEACVATAMRAYNERNWDYCNAPSANERRYFVKYLPDFAKGDDRRNAARSYRGALPWYHCRRFRLLDCRPDDLGPADPVYDSALAQLVFPPVVNELIEEVKLWRNHRDWYVRRGIPWKRGWLLYGPPGTGKTALTRAMAEDLDLPIFVYSLADMSNFSFMRAWTEMRASAPCIALIEDVDNVFHGRTNVSQGMRRDYFGAMRLQTTQKANEQERVNNQAPSANKDKDASQGGYDDLFDVGRLSFDCLLNVLDGVERNDGVFVVMTTNDLSRIDPALGQPRKRPDGAVEFISTRPGRIDRAIELTWMTPECMRTLARRILGEYPKALAEVLTFVEAHPDLEETPAQFQERCSQVALRCFWEDRQNKALPAPTGEKRQTHRELVYC